jgi:glycosyltransferase involved in cell wall biosynthesis
VGNVKPHKNLISLIRAFNQVKDKLPYDLVIVGKKDGFITNDDELNSFFETSERIQFTGFVDDNELKKLVHQADFSVFPSLYEGFGLPPLEAMASGTAVAVSNIPVLKEICGDAVVYFDPNDHQDIAETICKMENKGIRDELIGKGNQKAKQFTWEQCTDRTESIIRTILNGN